MSDFWATFLGVAAGATLMSAGFAVGCWWATRDRRYDR